MEQIVEFIDICDNFESKYRLDTLVPSQEDIDEMCSLIDKSVARDVLTLYNKNVSPTDEGLDLLIRRWAVAKYQFYVLFGRKLSVSFKKKLTIEEDSIKNKVIEFCTMPYVTIGVGDKAEKHDTTHFQYYIPIVSLFSEKSIRSNICIDDEMLKKCIPSYKPNQKVSRFFSKFFCDKIFDIEYSKVIQIKDKTETITVSIDFNDFMTASINDNSWSTCFSPDGCHSEAFYEPAFDDASIVAYISSKDFDIHDSQWNSKSIRAFCCIDKKTSSFAISRAYPNVNCTVFYDAVKELLEKVISEYWKEDITWNVDLVTVELNKTDCYGTYDTLEHGLHRIHIDPKKRYIDSLSSTYFVDPIKYLCSPCTTMPSKIYAGIEERICTVCGQKNKLYYRTICERCFDKYAPN